MSATTLAYSNTNTSALVQLDDGRLAIAFSPEPDHQTKSSGNPAITLSTTRYPVYETNGKRYTLIGSQIIVTTVKSKAERKIAAMSDAERAELLALLQRK